MRKKNVKKPVTKKSVSRKTTNEHPVKTMNSGIKKQYLKTSPVCKVTFKLPKQAAPDAKNVTIVGDFNAWDTNKTHMKHLKNGDFKVTLTLSNNSEHKFRYLIDGKKWENDWCADRYIPNAYGCDDSVVVV